MKDKIPLTIAAIFCVIIIGLLLYDISLWRTYYTETKHQTIYKYDTVYLKEVKP